MKHFHHSGGGAGRPEILTDEQSAHIQGVESVHILLGVDDVDERRFVDVVGQGKLDQNTVDPVIAVEPADRFGDLLLPDILGKFQHFGIEAAVLAGFFLVAYINFGCRIFSDQQNGKSGDSAVKLFKGFGLLGELLPDGLGKKLSV